ncbi:MAG: DNA polymerase III subunit delta [Anaerolineae bacterium]|nr:DNA polymerase III subunit delta [Anaerolineae bacterium]
MPSPTPITYVFSGQDEPGLREQLASFYESLGEHSALELNTTQLDGTLVTVGDIEAAARPVPFLADVRLVVVEDLTASANSRAILEQIPSMIAALPDWTRLVFVEAGLEESSSGKRGGRQQTLKKLINLVENDPRGKVLAFDTPRDLPRWLQERALHHQATLDIAAARLLAECVGGNLVLADTELAKLATYTAGTRAISKDDVALLIPYSAEANIFRMVDALGQRDGKTALTLLRKLLDAGDEPLRIFAMFTRQYRMIIQMREQLDSNQSVQGASRTLGMRDFIAEKIASQARQYRMEQLERIIEILLETDVAIKTGKLTGDLALEEFVARLSRSARHN